MCGIVGIASVEPVMHRAWLGEALAKMVHRGPDDIGERWFGDGRVGLGHRRLSIIDLSPAAHQPMEDCSGSLSIVFNGELYNFRELRKYLSGLGASFKSESDTEVVLEAYRRWGVECITRLQGMFAFAIYDFEKQDVFLARDRAGEKPLFYRHDGQTLRFASELKGLLADQTLPRTVEPEALDCYLGIGYVPGDACILKGYNKLPAAHAMRLDLRTGKLHKWRYWQPGELDEAGEYDEQTLLDELEALLEHSVGRQLTADVPVGVLLSGGVDSSLITAMAARTVPNVKTFAIRFPGHGGLDETEHARLIARHFKTEHIELDAREGSAEMLPTLAKQFDEPMADSSMIPTYLVSQLVRQHCKVALGGDGGDELFGGYAHYSRLLWLQHRLGRIPLPLRRGVSLAARKLLPVGLKGRNWLQGLGVDVEHGLPLIAAHFDVDTRRRLMADVDAWTPRAEQIFSSRVPESTDLLQRATRMDFQNYLAEDILVKIDRASMLNSLEVRAPMLDVHLLEFAFRKVPPRFKATPYEKKILLKRLTERLLPPEFDRKRKQGFSIPLATWLKRGPFRELFHDVLLDPESSFEPKMVRGLIQGMDRGRSNGERLFMLVMFELWRKEYSIQL